MSPHSFNPSDPTQVAVKISEFGMRLEAMQVQQTQAQQQLATVVQSLQLDLHEAVKQWASYGVTADRQVRDQSLLIEAQAAIRAIAARQDNADRRFSKWGGVVLGVSLATGTASGLVTWFGRQYLENTGAALREVRMTAKEHTEDARQRDEATDARLDRVEIYLAGSKLDPFRR